MIVPVSVQCKDDKKPKIRLGIVVDYIEDVATLRDFRDKMTELLMGCLASEEVNSNFTTDSLWWLVKLIDATTSSIDQELAKGGIS